jgi:hypothetical protein
MKLDRTITTNESPDSVGARIIAYFEKLGYKQLSSEPFLEFRRGSVKGSLFSNSPNKWQASASIQINPNSTRPAEIIVSMNINTIGQILTKEEKDYLSLGFHVFALIWLFSGLMAISKLNEMEQTNTFARKSLG